MPQTSKPSKTPVIDKIMDGLSRKELRAIRKCARARGVNEYLRPYISKSRIIAQTIHPFMTVESIFYAGVPDAAKLEDEDAEEGGDDNAEHSEDEIRAFKSIMKLERGFSVIVDACSTDPASFLGLIHLISEASGQSQGDDTSKLKTAIVEYLYDDPKEDSKFKFDYEIQQLISSDHKMSRGFYHLDTADLLCPLSMRDMFDRDPVAFASEVIDGKIAITDDNFPTFMYESGIEYDPDDLLTGFLRSNLLLRVFRHIFTGPSTALYETNAPNKSKAKIFSLTKVTGEMITYTCVQTYLALSSASQWKHFIDLFNLDDFYESIIRLINDNADTEWLKELLEWWGTQIPGLRPPKQKRKAIARSKRSKKGPSQAEHMQAQLREMELQLTQKEHELQERERHLEEQNCRPRTPPQNPRQSTPRRPRENIESHPTKRSRHIFEEDENEETEGEGEMEDDEDSPRVRDVGAVVQKVDKRQADDEADVDDEMDELADEYRYESLEFDRQVKALEHLNAPRVQAKEGRHEMESQPAKKAKVGSQPAKKAKKKDEAAPAPASQVSNGIQKKSKRAVESSSTQASNLRKTRSSSKRVLDDCSESESELVYAKSQQTAKAPAKKCHLCS